MLDLIQAILASNLSDADKLRVVKELCKEDQVDVGAPYIPSPFPKEPYWPNYPIITC